MSLFTEFDHLAPRIGADGTPIEYYEELRDEVRESGRHIGWSEQHRGFWVCVGWQESRDIFLQHDAFSNMESSFPKYGTSTGNRMILAEEDEPEHRRHRRVVNPPFSPTNAAMIDAKVRATANDLIDSFIETGRADFAQVMGDRMSERVSAIMLGLPPQDGALHRTWTDAATHGIYTDPARTERLMGEMDRYWTELIAEKRARPTDDVFSMVVHAEADGEKLTETELKDFFTILLFAGIDTTTPLLSSIVWRLAWDMDLRRRLAADPSRIDTLVIDEFLRLYPPAVTFRLALEDVTVHGADIKKGQYVCLAHWVSNRDPRQFPYPDQLIPDRTPNRYLTFGMGIHRCLGMHVLKVEMVAALQELLRRIPTFALDPERTSRWKCGQVSGMAEVPIVFPPGGGPGDAEWRPGSRTPLAAAVSAR